MGDRPSPHRVLLTREVSLHVVIVDESIGDAVCYVQVEVYCVNSGESVIFPADRWLATDEDPYQTTQTLYPYKDGAVDRSSSVDYQVDVYTSDVRFAGTDANVTLQLFGQLEDGTEMTSGKFGPCLLQYSAF